MLLVAISVLSSRLWFARSHGHCEGALKRFNCKDCKAEWPPVRTQSSVSLVGTSLCGRLGSVCKVYSKSKDSKAVCDLVSGLRSPRVKAPVAGLAQIDVKQAAVQGQGHLLEHSLNKGHSALLQLLFRGGDTHFSQHITVGRCHKMSTAHRPAAVHQL